MKIEITPPSKQSEDNENRKELLWEAREENLLKGWKQEMAEKSKYHFRKGEKNKKLYLSFGIPSTILPLIMAGLTGIVPVDPIVVSCLMMFAGILTGVQNFINFSKKSQVHFEFENKYSQLCLEIDSELCRPKIARCACDVFIERIKQQYHSLNQQAPI